ncbi:hypothetical protein ACFL06_02025 [Patescibacteria group bacterium]
MKINTRVAFIVCDIGAMIGLAAACLSPQVAWLMATVGGALTAGMLYLVWQYAPRAATIAKQDLFCIPLLWQKILDLRYISAFVKWGIVVSLLVTITWAGWGALGFYTVIKAEQSQYFLKFWESFWFFTTVISGLSAFALTLFAFVLAINNEPVFGNTDEERAKTVKVLALFCNAITVSAFFALSCIFVAVAIPVVTLCLVVLSVIFIGLFISAIPNILLWAGRITREAVGFVFTFIGVIGKNGFTFYHRVGFVLCAVDTAFGIAISYHIFVGIANMPFVPVLIFGGLLTGLLAAFNAEVVSKRLLRLVPNNS